MKKGLLILVLVLVLIFLLNGCKDQSLSQEDLKQKQMESFQKWSQSAQEEQKESVKPK